MAVPVLNEPVEGPEYPAYTAFYDRTDMVQDLQGEGYLKGHNSRAFISGIGSYAHVLSLLSILN